MAQPTEKLVAEPAPTIRLIARNLAKKFNTEWLFRDFNYTFGAANTYAITGPNGSGKSTLLQLLWGQLPPTAGTIQYEIQGKPIEADAVFKHLAIAAPYMDLIDEFTLKEQLEFHFSLKPLMRDYTITRVIHDLYLDEATDKYIGNFSSGMKQRLKLGLAFYSDVPVVFLDEPGSNLDSRAFQWYCNLLHTTCKNRLVIIASNNKNEYPENAQEISITSYKSKTG